MNLSVFQLLSVNLSLTYAFCRSSKGQHTFETYHDRVVRKCKRKPYPLDLGCYGPKAWSRPFGTMRELDIDWRAVIDDDEAVVENQHMILEQRFVGRKNSALPNFNLPPWPSTTRPSDLCG